VRLSLFPTKAVAGLKFMAGVFGFTFSVTRKLFSGLGINFVSSSIYEEFRLKNIGYSFIKRHIYLI
jgi:hypothetical protein